MKDVSCEVIRDLLPLYEDGAVSQETEALVRRHLADCPACREELRKMRTPISVPPEEDKELWERFEARRAKQRRKRRIGIACALSLLAAAVVFCFWYTRPRTWAEITGEDIRVDYAGCDILNPDWYAETADTNSPFMHWSIRQGSPAVDEAGDAILQVLERYTFRASLESLLPGDSIDVGGDTVSIHMVWGEKDGGFFYFGEDNKVGTFHGRLGREIYHFDPALFDELLQIVQEYGTLVPPYDPDTP